MKKKNGLSDNLLLKSPNKELEKEKDKPIWFFPACKKSIRLFGNFNSYFRNDNKLSEIRKAIRHGIKFRSDLLNLVPILPTGQYDAVHIRRGEHQYPAQRYVSTKLLNNLKKLLNPKKKK